MPADPNFRRDLEENESYERAQFNHHATLYNMRWASVDEDKAGTDAFGTWRAQPNGELKFQFKTDKKANKYGNLFFETHTSDGRKEGPQHSPTHYWSVLCPQENLIYFMSTWELRRIMDDWKMTYPRRSVRNPSFTMYGIAVPRRIVELSPALYYLEPLRVNGN